MKKVFALLMIAGVFALSSCGKKEAATETPAAAETEAPAAAETTEAPAADTAAAATDTAAAHSAH